MIKSMIQHPETGSAFNFLKTLGYGFGLYTDHGENQAIGKNGNMVELTFMNKAGKSKKSYSFEHIRDEATNKNYLEITHGSFTCSFHRSNMELEMDDDTKHPHIFAGGDDTDSSNTEKIRKNVMATQRYH